MPKRDNGMTGELAGSSARVVALVPRLALSVTEAAQSMGVSVDFFAEHVAPDLRWCRRGRKKLVAVTELERWIVENSARLFEDVR